MKLQVLNTNICFTTPLPSIIKNLFLILVFSVLACSCTKKQTKTTTKAINSILTVAGGGAAKNQMSAKVNNNNWQTKDPISNYLSSFNPNPPQACAITYKGTDKSTISFGFSGTGTYTIGPTTHTPGGSLEYTDSSGVTYTTERGTLKISQFTLASPGSGQLKVLVASFNFTTQVFNGKNFVINSGTFSYYQ